MSGPSYMHAWPFLQDSSWPQSWEQFALPSQAASTYWQPPAAKSGNPLSPSPRSGSKSGPPSSTPQPTLRLGRHRKPARSLQRTMLAPVAMKTPLRFKWKRSDGAPKEGQMEDAGLRRKCGGSHIRPPISPTLCLHGLFLFTMPNTPPSFLLH